MNNDLLEKLNNFVIQNQINEAIDTAEKALIDMPTTDFHVIIGKNMLHLKDELLAFIDNFYNQAIEKIDVKAIHSEMNGFTINYDLFQKTCIVDSRQNPLFQRFTQYELSEYNLVGRCNDTRRQWLVQIHF